MVTIIDHDVPGVPGKRVRTHRHPLMLIGSSIFVVLFILIPVIFTLVQAHAIGLTPLSNIIFTSFTASLLWNTIRLTVLVTVLAALIGTFAAWCTECTDLPMKKYWAILLILPVAIPDFVIAYGWITVAPSLSGYWGAVVVMTLGLYPLVYLPVAASFRGADAGQSEIAMSLGAHAVVTFFRITVRQARTALMGGCMLVALASLAEYGAFELLRYQTFTTTIFTEFQVDFNAPAASALSLMLVILSALFLTAEMGMRDKGRTSRVGMNAGRPIRDHHLQQWTVPTMLTLGAIAIMAIGIPVGTICYWMLQATHSSLPTSGSLLDATLATLGYSAGAAFCATIFALPLSILSLRYPSKLSVVLERLPMVMQALPGLVIALALVYCATRYADAVYQTSILLIAAYTMLFFPLALVAVRASLIRAPVGLEKIGASLGQHPMQVRWRITMPLILPGLAAAFCLVFLSAVTELTATLILIPTGSETLATQFWAYTSNVSFGAAGPYAAVMIAIAVIPGYLVGRWFNRLTTQES